MKKIIKFCLLILIFVVTIDVNAYAFLEYEDGGFLSLAEDNTLNQVYVSSGKKMNLNIHVGSSNISFGDSVIEDVKADKIKFNIKTTGGVNCNISNTNNDYYTFANNTFTLKNKTLPFDFSFDGNIGKITCSFPTINSYKKLSNDLSLIVSYEYKNVDFAQENKEENKSRTYKFIFGVVNENYYKALNEKPSITSVTINGKTYEEYKLGQELKFNDINDANLKIKINKNEFGSKNRIRLVLESLEKELSSEILTSNEKILNMPYGPHGITIEEKTEKEVFLDDVIYFDDFPEFIGFPEDFFDDSAINSKDYMYLFNRIDNRSNVNTLRLLSISDANINFKPELKNYMVTVPYKVSSVKINSTLTDPKSSYVNGFGNRTVNLNEGLNDVLVKVKAENGTETTYSIKITREKNDDSSLKTITIDDKEILIKEKQLNYSIIVDNKVIKPVVTAIPTDTNAKIEIDEIVELKEGDNEINIVVTAANGMKSNYVVNIIRDKLISTNSKLENITIKGYDLNFSKEILNYKLKLLNKEEKLDITVKTENEKATYLITGNKDLENESIIKIKVTAEDGKTITTYSIEIEKEKESKNSFIISIIVLILGIILCLIAIKSKKNKNQSNNQMNNSTTTSNMNHEFDPVKKEINSEDEFELKKKVVK